MDFLKLFEAVCVDQAVPETLYCQILRSQVAGRELGSILSDLPTHNIYEYALFK